MRSRPRAPAKVPATTAPSSGPSPSRRTASGRTSARWRRPGGRAEVAPRARGPALVDRDVDEVGEPEQLGHPRRRWRRRHTSGGAPAWRTRPPSSSTSRSASANASAWSWVTATTVRPSRANSAAELDDEPLAARAVERAERLVEEEDARRGRQRPGQRDALLLAAGERRDVAALACPSSPTSVEQLAHPLRRRVGAALALHPEAEGDVGARRRGAGTGRGAGTSSRRRAGAAASPCASTPSMATRAGVERLQPGDGPQQGRLAAAARAEHGHDLARRRREVDVVEGDGRRRTRPCAPATSTRGGHTHPLPPPARGRHRSTSSTATRGERPSARRSARSPARR